MFNDVTWIEGERLAKVYMERNGFKILETNFSCVGVELDIVALLSKKIQIKKLKQSYKEKCKNAQKFEKKLYKNSLKSIINNIKDLIVITEVKARSSGKFGLGLDAISDNKKNNLIRGARFLSSQPKYQGYQFRFDVASVDGGVVTYIENAF